MKYASIDIETTGLDPETCNIIEIGIVLEVGLDTPIRKLPWFHCYLDYSTFSGQARALAMHGEIFRRIAHKVDGYNYYAPEEVACQMAFFFSANGYEREERINPAGKNFANFDARFLDKIPGFKETIFLHHRTIDPATMYWNPLTDKHLPDTKTCYERAGIKEDVAHTAIDDALGVIKLVRAKWETK